MQELSNQTWRYWGQLGKSQVGYETLPFSNIKFTPNINTAESIQKVIIFRFFKDNYRIIGVKEDDNHVFYVIGFDFDHSVYDHGN